MADEQTSEQGAVSPHRLRTITERITETMRDERGDPPDTDEVERVVTDVARRLERAPIPDFVPLLTEHQATDELRARGVHSVIGETPSEAKEADTDATDATDPSTATNPPTENDSRTT